LNLQQHLQASESLIESSTEAWTQSHDFSLQLFFENLCVLRWSSPEMVCRKPRVSQLNCLSDPQCESGNVWSLVAGFSHHYGDMENDLKHQNKRQSLPVSSQL
jgi:hypothetical protein